MKQYFTLVQAFSTTHKSLAEYLDTQNIHYVLGADLYEELKMFDLNDPSAQSGTLLKIYRVLIDKHELSAIMLSVGGVTIIKNRTGVNLQNKIRRFFSWFLD